MENDPVTPFTQDELKLISRALNFYRQHPEYMSQEKLDAGEVQAAGELSTRIYRQNFRI